MAERVTYKDVETISKFRINVIIGLALLFISLPIIINYAVLFISSFSNKMLSGMTAHEIKFTLENWRMFFSGRLSTTQAVLRNFWDIMRYIFNTLVVGLGVSAVVTLTSMMSGYAFSRMKFKGRKFLMQFLILLHAFPGVALIIAVYTMYIAFKLSVPEHYLKMYSFTYVVFARAALEVPMSIWIMKGFFDRIPWEVEWSALVDGASRVYVWRRIILPLVKPGIATVAIFSFLAGWEDLIYVRTFLPITEKTLATYIEGLLSEGSLEIVHLPAVAAAGTFYLLPTILFFIFARSYMLQTSMSGVKM